MELVNVFSHYAGLTLKNRFLYAVNEHETNEICKIVKNAFGKYMLITGVHVFTLLLTNCEN
jgi:hypothetical protein